MIRIKSIVILLGFVINSYLLFGQQGNDDLPGNNLVQIPPSPNSASLGKYTEIPVSLNTGVPEISIPLFNLKEGELNLDAALMYHASGIKVEEEASWVGLGWSFSVGGSITRSVRCRPDDHANGFLKLGSQIPSEYLIDLDLVTMSRLDNALFFLSEVTNNKYDYEPDAFYYSNPSGNGSFMFNNHGQPSTIPFSDVEITPLSEHGEITAFMLTDGNGILYYYGDTLSRESNQFVEVTNTNNGPYGAIENFISTWLLNRIVNPLTGDVIQFYYKSSNLRSNSKSELQIWQQDCSYCQSFSPVSNQSNTTIINSTGKFIERIEINDNPILLYSSPRLDDEGVKLDSICVNDKKTIFSYDYFRASNNSTEMSDLRLKLNGLILVDNKTNDKSTYDFFYDQINLPAKNSKSQDYWGFYNGVSNTTLIPTTSYGLNTMPGGNREPNSQYTRACILKKIKFPTGGYTEYTYENNGFMGYPEPEEISSTGFIHNSLTDSINSGPSITQTVDLIFDSNYQYYSLELEGFIVDNSYMGAAVHYTAFAQIIDSSNTILFTGRISDSIPHFIIPIDDIISNNQYRLKMTMIRCDSLTLEVFLKYRFYDSIGLLIPREYDAGGLRIKTIEFNDSNGEKYYKSYDYCNSGYLTRLKPSYYTVSSLYRPYTSIDYEKLTRIVKYASPVGGLGGSANSVSYKKVIEYFGTQLSNNGYKIAYFREIPDDVNAGSFDPQCSLQYLRDKILVEEYYDNNGAIRKKTAYDYEYDPYHFEVIEGFRASKTNSIEGGIFDTDIIKNLYSFGRYNYSLPLERTKKIVTTDYLKNSAIVNSTSYAYSNRHLNPIKISTVKSDGKLIEEKFTYPQDYVNLDYNSCRDKYFLDLSECTSVFSDCFDQALSCNLLYGECYSKFSDADENYWKAYNKYLFDSIEDFPLVNERLLSWCGLQMVSAGYDYFGVNDFDIDDCMSENGFYNCINNLECGYLPCTAAANVKYCACTDSLDLKFANLYNNCNDEKLKAIYALALFKKNNTLLKKETYVDGSLISSITNDYKLVPINSLLSFPAIDKTIEFYPLSNSEETLITADIEDVNSNILQVDVNKYKTSYMYGYDKRYLLAKINNSFLLECGYTGFEKNETNGWSVNIDNLSDEYCFTGEKSVKISAQYGPGQEFFVGNQALNHSGYQASVWVKGSQDAYLHIEANDWSIHNRISNINGSDDQWHLLRVQLEKSVYESIINESLKFKVYVGNGSTTPAYFDDLRFYPLDAQMTTYTYKPLVGITSESGNNNRPTRYEYDGFGRLVLVKDFENNVIKKYEYNYKQ